MRSRELLRDDSQPIGVEISKLGRIAPKEHLIRFALGAFLAAAAGGIGILYGPKAGGLFLAFPAILPASLTLIEKKEGKAKAWADASGGVIGAIGLAGFGRGCSRDAAGSKAGRAHRQGLRARAFNRSDDSAAVS
jgi:hypothetical protein